jgi:hypothetical protein
LLLVIASFVVLATPNSVVGGCLSARAQAVTAITDLAILVRGDCRRVGNAGAPGTLRLGLSCESE